MNLQFENNDAPAALRDATGCFPDRLLNSDVHSRNVSRLEFVSVRQECRELADVDPERSEEDLRSHSHGDAADLKAAMELQAESVATQIEMARGEARLGAREEWEGELAERVAAERSMVLRTCEQFGRERARYFAQVESEVVKLALAIAERVLHREAKLDPLLLAAAVRVALEKVAEQSEVVLRVPAAEVALWRELFEGSASVDVSGDDRLDSGECVLDTSVGKLELGVQAQLVEIERGFFDLLQQRPS